MKLKLILGIFVAMTALIALAQDAAGSTTVTVAENEQFGSILTDGEGMSLYLFVNTDAADAAERMTEGVRESAVSCTGGCLDNWPPVTGQVEAGEGVDAELLYTAEFDGMEMAVYNGWPLYYFAADTAAGQTNGQGLGPDPNKWYLISPEGQPVTGM